MGGATSRKLAERNARGRVSDIIGYIDLHKESDKGNVGNE